MTAFDNFTLLLTLPDSEQANCLKIKGVESSL